MNWRVGITMQGGKTEKIRIRAFSEIMAIVKALEATRIHSADIVAISAKVEEKR